MRAMKCFNSVKAIIQTIQKRIKGILLLAMLIIPFLLYAVASGGSTGWVHFYLVLLTLNMIVAMHSA